MSNRHAARGAVLALAGLWLAACNSSDEVSGASSGVVPTPPRNLDRGCDLASYPSAQWLACEAGNFARLGEAPLEQATNLAFTARLLAQAAASTQALLARNLADPSWLLTSTVLPYCATQALVCAGDPYRWPQAEGPDGRAFYENEAVVTPVVFYDRDCARLSGRAWRPKTLAPGQRLPAVVIDNGSIGAPESSYWWAAQALVRAGYQVLSYDPRGQGRSDFITPAGGLGTNANPEVFWLNLVDAVDFLESTPATPYPHNLDCAGSYPTEVAPYNPEHATLDRERIGIAGHSLGAIGVSVVQGYGAPGADPWPGRLDSRNPVKAAVAWDSLITPDGHGLAPCDNAPLSNELCRLLVQIVGAGGKLPDFAPRVPSLSFSADYGLATMVPYLLPPDPENHKQAFQLWQETGVPVYSLGFQGTTHLDFSPIADAPATSWCPDTSSGACRGGYGLPAITYYTVAWLDRWLKKPGEPGYADADQRLVDDAGEHGAVKMSFHYRSARDYPDRSGKRQHCEDIRAGCE
ncbi:hypothetical protein D0B54_04600 [Solimonas sp. K1W22B-7]|uniref:alpha/beta hydrolase family protein n=1 Tax=Solimonas sp. K1W22B-7 TaxID=2303331 RepID=UPI000E334D7D|nr:hypothetical protein [Solimonas sp. K1W22B-7]AXQ27996.1 hypothetical protein D0B54_04600 [Solimonas sp. K1W22B-7]